MINPLAPAGTPCDWCGEAEPMVDTLTGLSCPVLQFEPVVIPEDGMDPNDYMHEPCHDSYVAASQRIIKRRRD